jgi:Zn-dependent protease
MDPLELVLPDHTRVPVLDEMTIGRAPGSTLRLDDPSVSRLQARISVDTAGDGAVVLEDAGSTYGTWLDGERVDGPRPLVDGARIRMGSQELVVERVRDEAEAGRTVVVPIGAAATGGAGTNPRVRAGHALKRLESSEGPRRWVLKDLESNRFLRMSDADAQLFELVDGHHSLRDLIGEAERRGGTGGPARLARLLSELAERGLLDGAADSPAAASRRVAFAQRLSRPREIAWPGAGPLFQLLYARGGRHLLSRRALLAIAALVAIGLVVFPYLVAGRYGTPFVVARKVGIGALVFLVGRFAVAAVHESAHALVMISFGRRVARAGLKVILIFPYAFVDTSEAWFEPRRRRIAISAAGPISDLSLGALFALSCLALPAGTIRDICFQLALGAYLGAFFNLNPFVDRDGYQILVDLLREPGLRRRARDQLRRRLSGRGVDSDSRVLRRYGAFGLAWSTLAACVAVGMSLRYEPRLDALALAPEQVVWAALAVVWLALFVPVIAAVAGPARERRRAREA